MVRGTLSSASRARFSCRLSLHKTGQRIEGEIKVSGIEVATVSIPCRRTSSTSGFTSVLSLTPIRLCTPRYNALFHNHFRPEILRRTKKSEFSSAISEFPDKTALSECLCQQHKEKFWSSKCRVKYQMPDNPYAPPSADEQPIAGDRADTPRARLRRWMPFSVLWGLVAGPIFVQTIILRKTEIWQGHLILGTGFGSGMVAALLWTGEFRCEHPIAKFFKIFGLIATCAFAFFLLTLMVWIDPIGRWFRSDPWLYAICVGSWSWILCLAPIGLVLARMGFLSSKSAFWFVLLGMPLADLLHGSLDSYLFKAFGFSYQLQLVWRAVTVGVWHATMLSMVALGWCAGANPQHPGIYLGAGFGRNRK